MFPHQLFCSPKDDGVEARLHLEQYAKGDVTLVLGGQNVEQVPMALSLCHIQRPFATGVLDREPTAYCDEMLNHSDRGTTMSGLVKRRE